MRCSAERFERASLTAAGRSLWGARNASSLCAFDGALTALVRFEALTDYQAPWAAW